MNKLNDFQKAEFKDKVERSLDDLPKVWEYAQEIEYQTGELGDATEYMAGCIVAVYCIDPDCFEDGYDYLHELVAERLMK